MVLSAHMVQRSLARVVLQGAGKSTKVSTFPDVSGVLPSASSFWTEGCLTTADLLDIVICDLEGRNIHGDDDKAETGKTQRRQKDN